MLDLLADRPESEGLSVLCLGAHSDDIEIGCGGTLLRLRDEVPDLEMRWIVFSGAGKRAEEARESARRLLGDTPSTEVEVLEFRDGFFPDDWAEIKSAFEKLKSGRSPDVIMTHHGDDRHQDHRVVSELTWNTFRDHLILEYEVPKWDGDLGQPNLYVPLEEETARRKAHHLVDTFQSQRDRAWFDEDTFLGLMRLRGVECVSPARYAEAFHARKVVLRV